MPYRVQKVFKVVHAFIYNFLSINQTEIRYIHFLLGFIVNTVLIIS